MATVKNSLIGTVSHFGKEGSEIHGRPKGLAMVVTFLVRCESQAEIDCFWDKLSKGGEPKARQCGWDPGKPGRVMKPLLKMKKLDLATLQKAYNA